MTPQPYMAVRNRRHQRACRPERLRRPGRPSRRPSLDLEQRNGCRSLPSTTPWPVALRRGRAALIGAQHRFDPGSIETQPGASPTANPDRAELGLVLVDPAPVQAEESRDLGRVEQIGGLRHGTGAESRNPLDHPVSDAFRKLGLSDRRP